MKNQSSLTPLILCIDFDPIDSALLSLCLVIDGEIVADIAKAYYALPVRAVITDTSRHLHERTSVRRKASPEQAFY